MNSCIDNVKLGVVVGTGEGEAALLKILQIS